MAASRTRRSGARSLAVSCSQPSRRYFLCLWYSACCTANQPTLPRQNRKKMFHQRSLRPSPPQPKHTPLYMSTTTPTDSVSSDEQKTGPVQPRRRHRFILMSGGAMLLVALVAGFVPQFRQRQTTAADTKELAIPTVAVVFPTATTPRSGLNLPAEVKPWQEASIFSRVNGYLKDSVLGIRAAGRQRPLNAGT